MANNKAHALAREELIRVLTAYKGVTTSPGEADGTTLIDSNLRNNPSISKDAIPEKTVLIMSGDAIQEDKGAASFDNDTGKITLQGTGFSAQIVAGTTYRILNFSSVEMDVARIEAALGNLTGDMSAVTQSEAASLAAYQVLFKEHFRAHDQTRICLVVPDLANLHLDLPNTAIRAELDKIGTVSLLDQTGVDGGQEDWDAYDLAVVGSDAGGYTFTTSNIDDLISFHGPIMVCCSAVAEHLLMGTAAAQSTSDTNEYCETIANRVMQLVFGSVGEKVLFDSAQVSDRLDMSDADLTEHVLMVDATGEGPGLTVVGWLPGESVDAETYELNDGSTIPSGRLFAGCFVHADHLTDLGKLLLRRIARNLTEAHVHSLTVNVKRSYQEQIPDTAISISPDTTTADPPSADSENSVVDIAKKQNRAFVLRSLFINISALGGGTNTMTFKLWIDIGGTPTEVDSVDVTSTGYQNLMDLFGLPEVHADSIHITATVNADTGAIAGIFRYAEAKK